MLGRQWTSLLAGALIGGVNGPAYEWNTRILETLPTDTLQEMYCALKAHDAT